MEAEGEAPGDDAARDERLQRGRLTMEAEGSSSLRDVMAAISASTGPPHDGGGRRAYEIAPFAIFLLLQRGRLTMEAEGSWKLTGGGTGRPSASTGPPHDGGGRHDGGLFFGQGVVRASTGPPHDGGGRHTSYLRTPIPQAASTGPPHDGGGRRLDDADNATSAFGLQRGRLTMEAEGTKQQQRVLSATHMLQRGRLTMEAEGRLSAEEAADALSLQRGRLTMEAEGADELERTAAEGDASTGPPHDGGGRRPGEHHGLVRP